MNYPKWLKIAENKLGIKEVPGDAACKDIIEFHAFTTLRATSDEVPWCSAFVNYCMENASIKGTRSAAARSWLQWGIELFKPVKGCIVILKRGNNPAQGHVGFFINSKPGLTRILGGNQKDSVCYSWFPVAHVLDYRWPVGVPIEDSEEDVKALI